VTRYQATTNNVGGLFETQCTSVAEEPTEHRYDTQCTHTRLIHVTLQKRLQYSLLWHCDRNSMDTTHNGLTLVPCTPVTL